MEESALPSAFDYNYKCHYTQIEGLLVFFYHDKYEDWNKMRTKHRPQGKNHISSLEEEYGSSRVVTRIICEKVCPSRTSGAPEL